MEMNPYDAPKDAVDDEMQLPDLGRSDCPVCATPQRRYSLLNPRHNCPTCGNVLRLVFPAWMSFLNLPVFLAVFWIIGYAPKIYSRYAIFICPMVCAVLYQTALFAVGRIRVNVPKANPWPSDGQTFNIFKLMAWVFVFLGTLFSVMISCMTGSGMLLQIFACVCVVIFVVFVIYMLTTAKTSPQGHLELPHSRRIAQRSLLWMALAVSLGAGLGVAIAAI